MKKLRVIGYTRVSTLEQSREGVSLDNQEHKIRAYADLKDMELVEMIVEEGKSGKTMNRPEGRIRTFEGKTRQIYSLVQLTTLPPPGVSNYT